MSASFSREQNQISPAFVIGVTGHMDIPDEDVAELKERLRLFFQWLREEAESSVMQENWWPRCIDDQGIEKPVPGLGLGNEHRIVLLTSMAPGADTIAAKVALNEGIEVRCPLPFPKEVYADASTFRTTKERDQFKKFLDQQGIDHFPVVLTEDINLTEGEREEKYEDIVNDGGKRRTRYRAAGEYVANYCHLLLAMHSNPTGSDRSHEGAAAIAEYHRRGPTSGLLPSSNHFPWIDSGCVFYLFTRKTGKDSVSGDWKTQKAQLLPPYFLKPDHSSDKKLDVEKLWVKKGDTYLRSMVGMFAKYSQAAGRIGVPEKVDREKALKSTLGYSSHGESELTKQSLSPETNTFLREAAEFEIIRKRASTIASDSDEKRKSLMMWMAILAFLAAFCFHGFSHWHFADKHVATADENNISEKTLGKLKKKEKIWALGFLVMTVGVVGIAAGRFLYYKKFSDHEWLRFDARALAEGLRVQFYWSVIGLHESVASQYMQRQKGELDWIRNAISSISFPYHRWRDKFLKLPQQDQKKIYWAVIENWLGKQQSYFEKTSIPKFESLHHRFHNWGWALTLAGIFQTGLLLIAFLPLGWYSVQKNFPDAPKWVAKEPATIHPTALLYGLAGSLLLAVLIFGFQKVKNTRKPHARNSHHHHVAHRDKKLIGRILDHISWVGQLPLALLLSFLICLAVKMLPMELWWMPDPKALWIILTGVALVGGAICIAWAEKLALSENLRQYQAMAHLYRNAKLRAKELLQEWKAESENSNHTDNSGDPGKTNASNVSIKSTAQIQLDELLRDIGKEALDENAEWLLLHRSRPFEPFLAG